MVAHPPGAPANSHVSCPSLMITTIYAIVASRQLRDLGLFNAFQSSTSRFRAGTAFPFQPEALPRDVLVDDRCKDDGSHAATFPSRDILG
jgi:hypothetical protein